MAEDVPFTKKEHENANARTHTATLAAATNDVDTEILVVDVNATVSIIIDAGSETVSIKASLVHEDDVTASDLKDAATGITGEYTNVFAGPISALAVVGPVSTNDVTITVLEKNNP